MAKYPNQKSYRINKKNTTKLFAIYGNPEIMDACKVLKGSGFKMYCCFFSNNDGYRLDGSPEYARKYWGIPKSTYYDGIQDLIDHGFIDVETGEVYQKAVEKQSETRTTEQQSEIRPKGTENKLNKSENGESNNTNNNTYNTFARDVAITVAKPEEEFIF